MRADGGCERTGGHECEKRETAWTTGVWRRRRSSKQEQEHEGRTGRRSAPESSGFGPVFLLGSFLLGSCSLVVFVLDWSGLCWRAGWSTAGSYPALLLGLLAGGGAGFSSASCWLNSARAQALSARPVDACRPCLACPARLACLVGAAWMPGRGLVVKAGRSRLERSAGGREIGARQPRFARATARRGYGLRIRDGRQTDGQRAAYRRSPNERASSRQGSTRKDTYTQTAATDRR